MSGISVLRLSILRKSEKLQRSCFLSLVLLILVCSSEAFVPVYASKAKPLLWSQNDLVCNLQIVPV